VFDLGRFVAERMRVLSATAFGRRVHKLGRVLRILRICSGIELTNPTGNGAICGRFVERELEPRPQIQLRLRCASFADDAVKQVTLGKSQSD
jgi:hypothetical protein